VGLVPVLRASVSLDGLSAIAAVPGVGWATWSEPGRLRVFDFALEEIFAVSTESRMRAGHTLSRDRQLVVVAHRDRLVVQDRAGAVLRELAHPPWVNAAARRAAATSMPGSVCGDDSHRRRPGPVGRG
jgi:hypothetical protein